MSAYKVLLKDGTIVTIAGAVRASKDGAGTYLYDADGKQIATFGDGEAKYAIPADAPVEQPSGDAPA
jgi:hypothetical protein